MQPVTAKRLTARLLLILALVGNLGPLALATAAARPHACCVRKAVHHCHASRTSEQVSEAEQLAIRDAICNHDCCRAATPAQWAHAQSPAATAFAQNVETYLGQSRPVAPNTELSRFQSSRAPPAC